MIGGISFIPLIGVIFGCVAILWGLLSNKAGGKVLALVGALGIGSTVLLYGSLFYFGFVQRGGPYDHLRCQAAQGSLNALVPFVEFYKLQYGEYPKSMKQLQNLFPRNSFAGLTMFDSSEARFQQRYFYYAVADANHYYLRGLGADGLPFTADDIAPSFKQEPGGKIGLLVDKPDQIPPDQSGN